MKKLILSIATLSLMSFTTIQIHTHYLLNESITNIQDMKEWMLQDVESGRIDPELGEDYINWLQVTENNLIEYVNITN